MGIFYCHDCKGKCKNEWKCDCGAVYDCDEAICESCWGEDA